MTLPGPKCFALAPGGPAGRRPRDYHCCRRQGHAGEHVSFTLRWKDGEVLARTKYPDTRAASELGQVPTPDEALVGVLRARVGHLDEELARCKAMLKESVVRCNEISEALGSPPTWEAAMARARERVGWLNEQDAQTLMGRASQLIEDNRQITDVLATLWNALDAIERGRCLDGCSGWPCTCAAQRARAVLQEARAAEQAFQEKKIGEKLIKEGQAHPLSDAELRRIFDATKVVQAMKVADREALWGRIMEGRARPRVGLCPRCRVHNIYGSETVCAVCSEREKAGG